jgi:hypothetical protein
MSEYVVRFSRRQRIEHLLVMLLFVVLAVTGFPQKFPDNGWARVTVDLLGGIERTRWLHRAAFRTRYAFATPRPASRRTNANPMKGRNSANAPPIAGARASTASAGTRT